MRIHKEKRGAEENEKGIAQHGEEGEVVAVIFCAAEADSQRVLKKDSACRRQRYGQTKAHASQYKQRQTLFQALCGCGEYDNGPEKGVGDGHACGQNAQEYYSGGVFPACVVIAHQKNAAGVDIALGNESVEKGREGQRIDGAQQHGVARTQMVKFIENFIQVKHGYQRNT